MVHGAETRAIAALLVACGGAFAACASTPAPKPRTATYLRAVEARVAAAAELQRFALRHNPASCDCPPFEVRLGDVWQRAELVGVDPDDPAILALEAAIEARPDAELTVEGRIEGELATCARGTLYVSLVPSALVEPEPAAPEPEPGSGGASSPD